MSGTLYIVATPIGNLEDLSPRARRILTDADLVAAEDTRHTGRLLSHIGVKTRQMALHEHNEAEVVEQLLALLAAGSDIALVSDAGTPLISDPGYRLVAGAHEAGYPVSPVPGPSALLAGLSASGLPTDRFTFEGFLPNRQSARRTRLEALADEPRTMLFFESVHRIGETIADMAAIFGSGRPAFIGRELTKRHEQSVRGDLGALADAIGEGAVPRKGEFVIAVRGSVDAASTSIDADRLLRELAAVLPGRQAAAIAARVTGISRNAAYARMLEITGDD